MSRKNYNVVLNSEYSTTDTATNNNTDKNYYIDWSATLPDKNFKLSFTFISEATYIITLSDILVVTIDFLNQGNNYICQRSTVSYQATSSNILGLLFPTYLDLVTYKAYFRADKNFNSLIYLSRPRQNNFNVQIVDNNKPALP